MNYTIMFLLSFLSGHVVSHDMRTLRLSRTNDVRFQCNTSGCSPFFTVSKPTLRDCQIACLSNTNCRTMTFDQSANQCQLFADIPGQFGNMIAQMGAVTLTAIDNRQLSAPVTTSTTTSTTTVTSTSSTTSTSSITTSTTSSTTSRTTTTTTPLTTAPCPVTYTQSFTYGSVPMSSTQCSAWSSFVASLTCSSYSSVRLYGSNDATGLTITNPSVASAIAVALRTNVTYTGASNGYTWAAGVAGCGVEITSTGVLCQCSTSYTLRPCIGNDNWGGINGVSCAAASQTISLTFQ